MSEEVWVSIITTIVVPIVLRVLTHYFPWLADAVTPVEPPAVEGSAGEETSS